uniref:helix-turn-helix domain-containing protein n=1 Tax=Streptococcus pluranimalium TaxID=82348 RepID=UPI003F68E8A6
MFSERLKQLRIDRNLRQKDIAEYFGTSPQSYAQWEKGLRKPSQDSLEKLAKFFDVSIDYLLGNTDQKNAFDIDEEALEASLRKSIGYNGQPPTEQEVQNMKNALIDYLKNR